MPRSQRLQLPTFLEEAIDAGAQVLGAGLELSPEQRGQAAAGVPVTWSPDQAREVMMRVLAVFCDRNAKSLVYIPEGVTLATMQRNAMIWAAYQQDGPAPSFTRRHTRQRIDELAAQYDLTSQQVYAIVARERRAEIADRQAELPGIDAAG